jgi:hypothetical protein
MKSLKIFAVAALFVVPALAARVALSQQDSGSQTREENFREYITLLRADIKAQRKDIIAELMQFDDEDDAKFWPLFEQYDAELAKMGEGRTQLIIEYSRNYENFTDSKADTLMSKAFEMEAQRTMLKKKYFDIMKGSIGAARAAKFFLIENQIQHLVDLQISAQLPTAQVPSK